MTTYLTSDWLSQVLKDKDSEIHKLDLDNARLRKQVGELNRKLSVIETELTHTKGKYCSLQSQIIGCGR